MYSHIKMVNISKSIFILTAPRVDSVKVNGNQRELQLDYQWKSLLKACLIEKNPDLTKDVSNNVSNFTNIT